MKILYVIGQLSYGGAERQLYELIKRLSDKTDFEIIVTSLSSQNHPYKKRLEELGTTVLEIPRKRGFDISRIQKLRQIINEHQPDLIHSYLENATNYTCWASFLSSYPHIAAVRNASRNRGFMRQMLDRFSHSSAKHITVNSHALKKHCVRQLGVSPEKITVIYNFIDFERWTADHSQQSRQLREKMGFSSENHIVGTIGRLTHQKNPFLFQGIARKLVSSMTNTKFLVVGDGPLRNELIEAGKDLIEKKRLFYAGQTDHPEYYLKLMDVFLLTSHYEGFPNVVLEAMASGVPVISTPVEGIEEFVTHEKTGFIANPNPDSFAHYTRHLLQQKELQDHFTEQATEAIAQTFREETLLEQFIQLYKRFV